MEEKLELYLDTKELIKALEFTTKVLKGKPTSEIYAFNKFIANGNKVDIEAIEMYEAAKTSVKAQVNGTGEFIIDPKQLLIMLKNVDIDEIIITKEPEKNYIEIQSGWNVTSMPIGNIESYPSFPDINDTKQIEIATEELKELIENTTFACSTDEARPVFTGIQLDTAKAQIAASNTHMLAISSFKVNHKPENSKTIIIPAKTLDKLIRTTIQDKTVKINFNDTNLYITFDNTTLVSRLINGTYPDVNRVIPKNSKVKCKIHKKAFEKMLNRIKVFTDNDNNIIKIEINNKEKTLILSASSQKGSSKEAIKIEDLITDNENENFKIAFNSNYITEITKRIKGDNMVMLMNTSVSPAIIAENEYSNNKYIVTPLRVVQ